MHHEHSDTPDASREVIHPALIRVYWRMAVWLTDIVEHMWRQDPLRRSKHAVLNFGCGNTFPAGVVNSDLFAPHRFITGKPRPQLFWTGCTRCRIWPAAFARWCAST